VNSRNRDEMLAPYHYGRAQFLDDVAWIGLDPDQAFSQSSLRRQRDRLMQDHHPDRGGSEEMAARINVTYSRMSVWLDRHLHNRNYLRMRRDQAYAREAAKNAAASPPPVNHKIDTAKFYAAVLTTAVAVMGIGLSGLARRRR
jgi:hypothetical protein